MNRKHDAHSAKKENFIKPSSALAPHGRALKRFQNKGAKPGCKRRLQFYYKTAKTWKNLLTCDIIEPEEERMVFRMTLKSYRVEMTNTTTGKKEIRHTCVS